MLERQDVIDYTAKKQELQLILEQLFGEIMTSFNLEGFLADPRGYTRAFLVTGTVRAVESVVGDAMKAGQALAEKAKG